MIRKIGLLSFFLLSLLFANSCSTTKAVSDSSPTEATTQGRDGSSFEKAVVVSSIAKEYEWIEANYPGSKVQKQALVYHGGKPHDVLTFRTTSGEVKTAYFDISKFFGKGF
jgi:hypothetical protein